MKMQRKANETFSLTDYNVGMNDVLSQPLNHDSLPLLD